MILVAPVSGLTLRLGCQSSKAAAQRIARVLIVTCPKLRSAAFGFLRLSVKKSFIDEHVTEQISLGDFVLSGGEIPAMALLDAVARLQPGVLNTVASHQQDSFNPCLLYTSDAADE